MTSPLFDRMWCLVAIYDDGTSQRVYWPSPVELERLIPAIEAAMRRGDEGFAVASWREVDSGRVVESTAPLPLRDLRYLSLRSPVGGPSSGRHRAVFRGLEGAPHSPPAGWRQPG